MPPTSACGNGRAPQGARGLKLTAWFNISFQKCRAPQGARGLKFTDPAEASGSGSRAPQGARGLKYRGHLLISNWAVSRPARGAWVEIKSDAAERIGGIVAPRKGRVG